MPVDLTTLIEPLTRAVNPPGQDFYPGTDASEWEGRLADAFWAGRLDGFFVGYVEADGEVSPVSGSEDLDRRYQQVIIEYAAMRALEAKLLSLATAQKYKAGPVEVETQRSAQVLAELLKSALGRLTRIRDDIVTNAQAATSTAFLDGIVVAGHRFYADLPYGWAN